MRRFPYKLLLAIPLLAAASQMSRLLVEPLTLDGGAPPERVAAALPAKSKPSSPLNEVLTRLADLESRPVISRSAIVSPKSVLQVEQRAILGRINAKRGREGRRAIQISRPLCDAAASYLAHHLKNGFQQIDTKQLTYFIYQAGGIAPPATVSLIPVSNGEVDWEQLDPIVSGLDATHAGFASMDDPSAGNRWTLAIFSDQAVELAPVSRNLKYARGMSLHGTLLGEVSEPEVWVTTPFGKTNKLASIVQGDRFYADLAFPDGNGTYEIEVMVKGRLGPKIAALFPIHVGTRPALPLPEGPPVVNPQSREAAEEYLFKAMNADRAKAGLPKVALNRSLLAAAREHSDEMANNNYVAHISPLSNEDHSVRLKRRGVPFVASGENIAAASSDIGKIQPGLMNSPGHRSNIMNPDWTEGAVGVAMKEERGQRTYFATQLFLQPVEYIDSSRYSREVLEELNDGASKAGHPLYSWSYALAELAQREARRVANADPAELSVIELKNLPAQLAAVSLSDHNVAYQVFRIVGGQDVEYEYKVHSTNFPLIGVGVFQGTSKHSGPGTIWGVVLYAGRG